MRVPPRTPQSTPEQDFRRFRSSGDAQALGRVFDALAPELLLVAAHTCGRGAAEDLVQTTFLRAITDAARWDDARPLLPWLVGILANLALQERARAARRPDPARVATPTAAEDPAGAAERGEVGLALATALRGLPRHYRQALVLRLVHGLEPTAIAHALGAPVPTIKSRLQRGLDLLRRALPAGLQLAVAPWAARSLASVREVVLSKAVSVSAAAATTAALVGLGGIVMTKKLLAIAVGAALASLLVWGGIHWFAGPAEPPASTMPVSVAAAVGDVAGAAESPEAQRVAVSPSTADASTAAAAEVAAAPMVRGRVVDPDGRALPGVLVLLGEKRVQMFEDLGNFLARASSDLEREAESAQAAMTRTDPNGAFALPRPDPARPHMLAAWSKERGGRGIDLPDGDAPIDLVLSVDPLTVGRVQSRADGKGIGSAMVNVWPAKSGMPIAYTVADAEGRFELQRLPPGAYRLRASCRGFADGAAEFELAAGETDRTLDIPMAPLPRFAALLVDAAGMPWSCARLRQQLGVPLTEVVAMLSKRSFARLEETMVRSWEREVLDFETDGTVRGYVRDREQRMFSLWSSGEKLFEIEVADFAADRLVVALQPRGGLELQVALRFEPPAVPQPEVTLMATDPSGFGIHAVARALTTTAFGTLRLPLQFAGSRCGLLAQCEGRVPCYQIVEVPKQGGGIWQEIVLAPPAGGLRGAVVDGGGAPIGDATVLLVDAGGNVVLPPDRARTNAAADGTFAFPDLPPCALRLLVEASGFAPRAFPVDLHGVQPTRCELRPGRKAEGRLPGNRDGSQVRVLDAAGRVLADDRVSGTRRHGLSIGLTVDPEAASVECFDLVTGDLFARGPIGADGTIALAECTPEAAGGR